MAIIAPDMEFTPNLTSPAQMVAMIGILHAVHQAAVLAKANEIASAGIADREERLRLFDEYSREITKTAKGLLSERISFEDEAAGSGAGLELIAIVHSGIRGKL